LARPLGGALGRQDQEVGITSRTQLSRFIRWSDDVSWVTSPASLLPIQEFDAGDEHRRFEDIRNRSRLARGAL
jgi:hypothetical protein